MSKIVTTIILIFHQLAVSQNPLDSIPMLLKENLLFVPVQVNQSMTLHFLFDTGAEVIVMDHKVARKLNLSSTGESRIKTAGKSIDAITSEDNTLSIGRIVLDSQSIEIFSLQHLSDYLKIKVDGVIGHELLKHYVVRTDIEKMKCICTIRLLVPT